MTNEFGEIIDELPHFLVQNRVNIPGAQQDLAGAFFFQEVAVGLENWSDSLCAYLTPDFQIEEIVTRTGKLLHLLGFHVKVHVDKILTENWNENWKRNFKALKIGNCFLVKPSWENPGREINRIVITMDPGRAFGAGNREGTQRVLELMEPTAKPRMSLWDVETGTGILAEEKSAFFENLTHYPVNVRKIWQEGERIGMIAQKEKVS